MLGVHWLTSGYKQGAYGRQGLQHTGGGSGSLGQAAHVMRVCRTRLFCLADPPDMRVLSDSSAARHDTVVMLVIASFITCHLSLHPLSLSLH